MRRIAALVLIVAAGCGGGDREGLTADSAVMQAGPPPPDSGATTSGAGSDTGVSDSLGVDSTVTSNPVVVLIADSVAGDVLFRRKGKCLSCHGLGGRGIDALGPNLRDTVWLHGDGSFAFIQRTIMEGIARPKVASIGMPSFARTANVEASALSTTLSPEEIHQITAYVFTLSHPGSAVADTTSTVVDTLAGRRDSLLPPIPPPAPALSGTVPSAPDTHIGR